jgi:Fic family protein
MRGKLVQQQWVFDPANDYMPARYRRPCSYDAFVPEPIADWTPELSGDLAGIVSDAQQELGRLDATSDPALHVLSRLLLRTEAIASSRIEDMQVGVRQLARAEAKHDLGTKVGADSIAILAAIDAMQFAVDEVADDQGTVTASRLSDIHAMLMADAPRWTAPGTIRDRQNWIGGNDYNPCGAEFVPPPPDDVDRLLVDLERALDSERLPAIVQAAIVHAQFETIHPFNDGNGRVGRALIHVVLRRRGIVRNVVPPVSLVLSRHRGRYVDALTRFRAGDPADWIELFSYALAVAARVSMQYLDEVRSLREQWRERVTQLPSTPRADAAVWRLIDHLPAHPVIMGPTAVAVTGRSKPAVNQAIEQLVAAGVLVPVTTGARNRAWEVHGMLDLIESLENEPR